MRRLLLFILLLPTFIFSTEPFVEIYKTHDNGLYGRSEDRDIILSIKDSVFKRHNTIIADSEYNLLTAVVLDSEVVNRLEERFTGRESIQIGYVKISKSENIYTIEDDNLFLSFSFSIEKPNKEILDVIANHYEKMPEIRENVLEHYKNNYVIRIFSAENLLQSEAKEITYDEALVMATIIGDKDQWLWGIHNGTDYLRPLLFK